MGSVDKAALRRVRTVDMLSTPISDVPTVKSPKTPTLSAAPTVDFKTSDTSQDEAATTKEKPTSVEKTSAPKAKAKSNPKGSTAKAKIACKPTPKKSARFMRMKQHLDEAKLKRLDQEAAKKKTSNTSKTKQTNKIKVKATDEVENNKSPSNKALSLKRKQETGDENGSPSKKGKGDKGNGREGKDAAVDPGETSHKSEATARKAHAMYMKYWRSIKSTEVAILQI